MKEQQKKELMEYARKKYGGGYSVIPGGNGPNFWVEVSQKKTDRRKKEGFRWVELEILNFWNIETK